MLLVFDGWAEVNVGGCKVETPRWLRRVLRTVGLIGEGEMGVRGRARVAGAAVGTASMSLGLAARASIMAVV